MTPGWRGDAELTGHTVAKSRIGLAGESIQWGKPVQLRLPAAKPLRGGYAVPNLSIESGVSD